MRAEFPVSRSCSQPAPIGRRLRVAVISDFAEEGWPSMDLVAEMLMENLRDRWSSSIRVEQIRPEFVRGLGRVPLAGKSKLAFNTDRFLNRFWNYPRFVRRIRDRFGVFHVVDHSYANLVHYLPSGRTVVTCHDLDTFRCLLEPARERRSLPFRMMARRVLEGLRRAAMVACVSRAIRDAILSHRLVATDRLVVIPNGVDPACLPDPDSRADAEATRMLGPVDPEIAEFLHVGSTIPRKRIDVLLRTFAVLRTKFGETRLIHAGGRFSARQRDMIVALNLNSAVVELPFLDKATLAAVYRRATMLLLPSEAEGFGLPAIEAMACGTPAVVSELPVLREVCDDAAEYCPVADPNAWVATIVRLLRERRDYPGGWHARRTACIKQARKFTWSEYADRIVELYQALDTQRIPAVRT